MCERTPASLGFRQGCQRFDSQCLQTSGETPLHPGPTFLKGGGGGRNPRRDQCFLLERLTHQESLYYLLSLCHHTITAGLLFPPHYLLPTRGVGGARHLTPTENRACVSPSHLGGYQTRPFLGLRGNCWGGVHECVCMRPCLQRRRRKEKKKQNHPQRPRKEPHSHTSWSEWLLLTKLVKARPRRTWRCFRGF